LIAAHVLSLTPRLVEPVQELGSLPITLAGTAEQQARWFPALASGEDLIAFALTEAEAGSDVAAARTTARRDGDDYVIAGSKRFISQGSVADLVVVFAVTKPDAPRHERLSAFARKAHALMQPFGEHGQYVNFLGAETGQDVVEAARQAYGPDTYDRLVALKNRFDPDNLFRLNHNIVPTSG